MAEPHPRQRGPPTGTARTKVIGAHLVEAHRTARAVLREHTDAQVGWTVANRAFVARPGAEEKKRELERIREDLYLEGARGDDLVGVQSYSSQ